MTLESLIKELKYIQNGKDKDGFHIYSEDDGHVKADRLLLEYINDSKVTEAFDDIDKWYE